MACAYKTPFGELDEKKTLEMDKKMGDIATKMRQRLAVKLQLGKQLPEMKTEVMLVTAKNELAKMLDIARMPKVAQSAGR